MISTTTAAALRAAGLRWSPGRGDRFVLPGRGMDDEVFVLSDMVIEAIDARGGQVLGFNGTTEWALDSVDAASALWLPREEQIRALLGSAFEALHPVPDGGWAVTAAGATTVSADPEEAYALALLRRLGRTARDLLPVAAAGFTERLRTVAAAAGRDGQDGGAWDARTPDGDWTVRDVVTDLLATHREVPAVLAGRAVTHRDRSGPASGSGTGAGPGADPLAAWEGAAAASMAAFARLRDLSVPVALPGGAAWAADYADQLLLDLLVHTWDLARGAGLGEAAERLDPACVDLALEHARRSAGQWSPAGLEAGDDVGATGAADGAPQDELLRLTGRDPGRGA